MRAGKVLVPNASGVIDSLTITSLNGGTGIAAVNGVTAGAVAASKAIVLDSNAELKAGTSADGFKLLGQLNVAVTTIGSSATNTTQTLLTYALAANILAANGNGVRAAAFGRFAGNAAPKTLQLNFGGVSINCGSVTQNGSSWIMEVLIWRLASASQKVLFKQNVGGAVTLPKSTSDTSVDTDTINITVQCLDASAAQSNVLLDGLVIEYMQ